MASDGAAEHENAHCSDDNEEDAEDTDAELSRKELLALNPFTLANFSCQKIRYMAAFDADKWHLELQHVSFPSACNPMTWEQGVAVMHGVQEGSCGHKNRVTAGDRAALEELRADIQGLLKDVGDRCGQCKFFVRLGPRSPKDAPMHASHQQLEQQQQWWQRCGVSESQIQATLAQILESTPELAGGRKHSATTVLRFFQQACYELLCVRSAEDAMSLLLGSCRVMQDVSRTLDKGRHGWDMSVVVRAWDDAVALDREYRTFVVGGQITAISQYDDQLVSDSELPNAEETVGAISQCLEQARSGLEHLGLANAASALVIDFLLVHEDASSTGGATWTARLIELNPFGPSTGACLFDWTAERRVLQGGLDLYGDLGEWESTHPPGRQLPSHVVEQAVQGVPFRFLQADNPRFSWEHLQAFWPDYMRLAPDKLISR